MSESDLGFDLSSFSDDLERRTMLSKREAELYLLRVKAGLSTAEASDVMGISSNNARGKIGRIRNKIQEAEETCKLKI